MLILMRKPGERIKIGDDIVIEILHVEHKRVKVGIQAPAHIRVDREEIAELRAVEQLPK